MLTRVNSLVNDFSDIQIPIKNASFPAPFQSGLEYSSPARGTWNIVHTGMLVPEGHEIFVCAAGCLRGVVLTAAEMGTGDRFSTVAIRENNLLDGDLEELIIDGVTDIINRMEKLPKAVLVYTSCVHHFTGCDLDMVYSVLRKRFPDIDFTDCYMNPIMRKSGITPDQLMRRQLYSLLRTRPINDRHVVIVGNDLPTDKQSELFELFSAANWQVKEIHDCKTYEEYQELADSSMYISYYPSAKAAAQALEERLGGKALHLPMKFDYNSIEASLNTLAEVLGIPAENYDDKKADCEKALAETAAIIGDMPIAIDYTAFPCPFSLARLLLSHGFNVDSVYADSLTADEKEDFIWLQQNHPNLILSPTVHPKMRFAATEITNRHLAIGQKAAHFSGTEHFVNIVQCGGHWGYSAILALCRLMQDAYNDKKDMKTLIRIKGWGCECCL